MTSTRSAVWAVPAGLVGARLYYVVSDNELYRGHWMNALQMWDGGLGIWAAAPPSGSPPGTSWPAADALDVAALFGRGGPGPAGGPGHRPVRQLLQPGAVRTAHDAAAVGSAHRRREPPGRLRPVRHLPPDLPLRGPVGSRPGRRAGLGRAPARAAPSGRGTSSCSTSPATRHRWAGSGSRCSASTTPTRSWGCGSTCATCVVVFAAAVLFLVLRHLLTEPPQVRARPSWPGSAAVGLGRLNLGRASLIGSAYRIGWHFGLTNRRDGVTVGLWTTAAGCPDAAGSGRHRSGRRVPGGSLRQGRFRHRISHQELTDQ